MTRLPVPAPASLPSFVSPLETESRSRFLALYGDAKRLFWDPASIDLAMDREHWAMIRAEYGRERYAEQVRLLCLLFHVGEEAVTRTLAPLCSAAARLGLGVDRELFLASQLYEEAKHLEFFARYFREVLGEDGAVAARELAAAPRAVLVDGLDAVAERLRREEDPERLRMAFVEGVTHVLGVVESMLARTGCVGAHDALAARGWLPGLQEGFRLVRRDEGRHVAFGIGCIAELVAAHPADEAVVRATFERRLPDVLATIRLFDHEHPLVDLERLEAHALDAWRTFVGAAGLAVDDGRAPADAEILDARDRGDILMA